MLAVAPLFLFPFCDDGTIGTVLLWLSLVAALWMFLEPSRHKGEILHETRVRVWQAVLSDPLTWVMLLVIAYTALRWTNSGVKLCFDSEKMTWMLAKPAVPVLPGSSGSSGFLPFAVSVEVLVLLAAARNALGKSARTVALFFTAFFAGIAAVGTAFLASRGNASAIAAMEHGWNNPSFWGSAFGVAMLAGFAALSGMLERNWNVLLVPYAVFAGLPAVGLVLFAPAPVVWIYLGAALIYALAATVLVYPSLGGKSVLKYFAGFVCAVTIAGVALVFATPEGVFESFLKPFKTGVLFPEGFDEMRARLVGVAREAWISADWTGTGIGSFPVHARFAATPADWAVWGRTPPTGAANGWITILSERGLVGMAAIGIVAGFLLFTCLKRLVLSFGRRVFIPLALFGAAVAAVAVSETFLDVPRHATLALAAYLFAISSSSIPVRKKEDAAEAGAKAGDGKNG